MIRQLQARCARLEDEQGHLADVARRQTERAEGMANDLEAADHGFDEVRLACEDLEYALTEAVIAPHLRNRLAQLQQLTDEYQEAQVRSERSADRYVRARARMLAAAHAAGTLARTYALVEGAGMGDPKQEAEQVLAGVRITGWTGLAEWECQDARCSHSTRELVWHESAPDRAHMACRCGRIWQAGPGAAERAERESRTHQVLGTGYSTTHRWSYFSEQVLESVDRALPGPDELRLVEVEAEAVITV